ncbi:hypothetical protein BJX96DRAFT_148649 [Aspergillus floccosus]
MHMTVLLGYSCFCVAKNSSCDDTHAFNHFVTSSSIYHISMPSVRTRGRELISLRLPSRGSCSTFDNLCIVLLCLKEYMSCLGMFVHSTVGG